MNKIFLTFLLVLSASASLASEGESEVVSACLKWGKNVDEFVLPEIYVVPRFEDFNGQGLMRNSLYHGFVCDGFAAPIREKTGIDVCSSTTGSSYSVEFLEAFGGQKPFIVVGRASGVGNVSVTIHFSFLHPDNRKAFATGEMHLAPSTVNVPSPDFTIPTASGEGAGPNFLSVFPRFSDFNMCADLRAPVFFDLACDSFLTQIVNRYGINFASYAQRNERLHIAAYQIQHLGPVRGLRSFTVVSELKGIEASSLHIAFAFYGADARVAAFGLLKVDLVDSKNHSLKVLSDEDRAAFSRDLQIP
jgi:acyl-CoA thioesterase FadM